MNTSKYIRYYGMTLKDLSRALQITEPAVIYRHKNGLLNHLAIRTDNLVMSAIDQRIHRLYAGIQSRCYNPKNPSYQRYGGRGIQNKITKAGLKYLWERDEADLLERPTIDRIDNNGHYCIENCRFIELRHNLKRRVLYRQ